jgi:hypothetical protein
VMFALRFQRTERRWEEAHDAPTIAQGSIRGLLGLGS